MKKLLITGSYVVGILGAATVGLATRAWRPHWIAIGFMEVVVAFVVMYCGLNLKET